MNAPKAKTSLVRGLLESAGRKVLVRFTRPFEQGSVMGYVTDIGPEFFLLALVDENIRFNGFQCLRLQDVRKLQVPAKCADFVETVLRLRADRIPTSGRVKVGSLQELLRTAGRAFPIITVHREKVAPDICHIGRVEAVGDSHLSLLEIGPDARWDDSPLSYLTKEITRIDFGGDYEEALTLVGGQHR